LAISNPPADSARGEIATLFIDDGRLYADWSGQVDARQPRRIETEEWMPNGWPTPTAPVEIGFLTRRELVASEGKLWSVQIYGDANDPARVQLVATVDRRDWKWGEECADDQLHADGRVSADQRAGKSRRGCFCSRGRRRRRILAALREKWPGIIKDYFEPALAKMAAC